MVFNGVNPRQSTGLASTSCSTEVAFGFCFLFELLEVLPRLLPSAAPIHQYVDSTPGSAPPSCSPMLLSMVSHNIAAKTRSGGMSALVASSALHESGVATMRDAGAVRLCLCQLRAAAASAACPGRGSAGSE